MQLTNMGSVFRLFRRCLHSDKNSHPKNGSANAPAKPQGTLGQPDGDGCESPPPPPPAQINLPQPPADGTTGLSPRGQIYAQPLGQTIPPSQSQPQLAFAGGPPDSLATNPIFLRALFSFDRQTTDDLSFKKGDRLFLIRQCAILDSSCTTFSVDILFHA